MTVARKPAPRQSFTASTTITATNAAWPVPALASPIVRVTVIGGGGGGNSSGVAGGAGGTSSFSTISASGGSGAPATAPGAAGTAGNAAGNGGMGHPQSFDTMRDNIPGNGGAIVVGYLDLSGVSTVAVTIGAGGTAATGAGAGGRGEVLVEYVAG